MSNLLFPDISIGKLTDLTPQLLAKHGARAVILDVDNTMSPPDTAESYPGIEAWIVSMRKNDIKLIILSNNTPERVKPYSDKTNIDFVCATKPSRKGYKLCFERLGVTPKECCCVGDQIYTDVLGANLSGCISCLVEPLSPDQTLFIGLKRALEKPILAIYKKRGKVK